ncbi:uncharacterized protein LOC117434839 isoform X1 [Acipenser ruthenus]|uniref:uncharacterized protein LOC117434839 isoform X1 n=2 Tax=Acipenser ruthenus TaxID=7906 RepID=UPI0015615759|nr:uncharacterized protein LOC117434839 isoform X1 [Acipenser ruthenus]
MEDVAELLAVLFICIVLHVMQYKSQSLDAAKQMRSKRCHRFFTELNARRRARRKMLLGILPKPRRSPVVWARERSTEWWQETVLGCFTEIDWLENFRMKKSTFFYIVSELQPLLEHQKTKFRDPVSVEKRVAIALWRFATNLEYRSIGQRFGVSRTTVYRCVRDVCLAITRVLKPKFLSKPTEADFKRASEGFREICGLPMCAGAVDCTHIPIIGPEENHADYYNAQGWHSVVLQGIVDHRGRFWDVSVGHPGNTHDSHALRMSSMWQKASSGTLFPSHSEELCGCTLSYMIAGDSGYPLKPWLMRPYSGREELTAPQRDFNARLGRAHAVAEGAFGRLKGRWRCLLKRNDCQLHILSSLLRACCILHNICEASEDRFFLDWLESDKAEDFPQPMCQAQDRGEEEESEPIRRALCQYLSSGLGEGGGV